MHTYKSKVTCCGNVMSRGNVMSHGNAMSHGNSTTCLEEITISMANFGILNVKCHVLPSVSTGVQMKL